MIRVPPAVSVIIPTYNRDALLREALASVATQTLHDIEVIICDDANSPSTQETVASFNDPRFIYAGNERRLGMLGNNLAGFRLSTAPLIANLHDDDRWHPDFLKTLATVLLTDESVDICFCEHLVIDTAGRQLPELSKRISDRYGRANLAAGHHQPIYDLVMSQTIPAVMGSVFRRSAVDFDSFDEAVGPAYDIWLSYRIARGGRAAYFVKEFLLDYRVHASSQTSVGGVGWSLGTATCWSRIQNDPAYRQWRRVCRHRVSESYAEAAGQLLQLGRRDEATSIAWNSVYAKPRLRSISILCVAILPGGIGLRIRKFWKSRFNIYRRLGVK